MWKIIFYSSNCVFYWKQLRYIYSYETKKVKQQQNISNNLINHLANYNYYFEDLIHNKFSALRSDKGQESNSKSTFEKGDSLV